MESPLTCIPDPIVALLGVAGQTGVIMLESINPLRTAGRTVEDAAVEGAAPPPKMKFAN